MRNSGPSNSSQNRGQKGRKPSGKNNQRGGSGQRSSASNSGSNRNGQQGPGSGQGQQHNASSRGKSRNQISQMWAADTSTLSSHMPNSVNTEWDPRAKKSSSTNGSVSHSRGKNKPSNPKTRSGKSDRPHSRSKPHSRPSSGASTQRPAPSQQAAPSRQSAPSNQVAAPHESKKIGNIDAFELFCAYHLGITQDKGYRTSNINEVANRFRSEQGMVKQALKEYDMDAESLLNRDFDMALAQLDIQVAPEGVDRLELARGIYEDFKNAPHIKRDWKKILEEDRKENQKIFKD